MRPCNASEISPGVEDNRFFVMGSGGVTARTRAPPDGTERNGWERFLTRRPRNRIASKATKNDAAMPTPPIHMNSNSLRNVLVYATVAILGFSGCGRQSRGNADAAGAAAADPAKVNTSGSAGQSKNFGDTQTKATQDGRSPSASPTGLSQDVTADPTKQPPAQGTK